jgi:hypothetical protein
MLSLWHQGLHPYFWFTSGLKPEGNLPQGLPQGSNQFTSELKTKGKGCSTLPTKPFGRSKVKENTKYNNSTQGLSCVDVLLWQMQNCVLFQKVQLITVLISNTADLLQLNQIHICCQLMHPVEYAAYAS